MKINCLIIDDEFLARQLLEGYIQKVPFLQLVGQCETAIESLSLLQEQNVDLIFLDINMPELDGINFIKTLPQRPEIIITTAYSEHALEGYQLDVIEYLLKPIYFDRFLQAVNKANKMIALKRKADQVNDTPKQNTALTQPKTEENHLFIKTGNRKITKILLDDILYIESMHEYVRIHLNQESHTFYSSLKNLLDILPPEKFVQIHRSFIINFNKITVIEGNTVKINNIELSLGKNFKDDFLNRIKSKSIGITPPKSPS